VTPERLNIALIGATGKVAAPAHLNGLAAAPNANLYAVCDIDADKVGELAEQTGAKAFTSLDAVLADPNVDAIDLVTPPFVHAEQAVAAAKAGKHVYCEKPMAHSLADASEMVSAHQQAGTTLMVGESYVFHHPIVAARGVIDNGDIGDVLHIRETKGPWLMRGDEAKRLDGLSHEANAPWRVDPKLSGGGSFRGSWIMPLTSLRQPDILPPGLTLFRSRHIHKQASPPASVFRARVPQRVRRLLLWRGVLIVGSTAPGVRSNPARMPWTSSDLSRLSTEQRARLLSMARVADLHRE